MVCNDYNNTASIRCIVDGLPKNKKPWGKAEERKPLALDDYLFERKLQAVYDKTAASDDTPRAIKAVKKASKQLRHVFRKKKSTLKSAPKAPKQLYIDTPQASKKPKFTTLLQSTENTTPVRTDEHAKKQPLKWRKTIKKSVLRLRNYATRHKKQVIVGLGAVLLLAGGSSLFLAQRLQKQNTAPQVQGAATDTKPTFEALIPSESAKASIKFDETRKVASYQDVIDGERVVVSQQELSEKDRVDTNFLSRTATAFNLKTEVTTKKGQAFIGINIDKNTQFAMFTYKGFLVFIQAETTHKNQTIVEYIDSLQ